MHYLLPSCPEKQKYQGILHAPERSGKTIWFFIIQMISVDNSYRRIVRNMINDKKINLFVPFPKHLYIPTVVLTFVGPFKHEAEKDFIKKSDDFCHDDPYSDDRERLQKNP